MSSKNSSKTDWDGLLREFAKQQDAHLTARKSANQKHRSTGGKDQQNAADRSRSIDIVDDDDDSDADDFEGFEEYSHRLGYLDSVTSQNVEEKLLSTTSTPATSRVSSKTMIPRLTTDSLPQSQASIAAQKKESLARKKSESVECLVSLAKRSSDSFVVPAELPKKREMSVDRKVSSGGEPNTSNRMKSFRQSELIELNTAQPIRFKRPGLAQDDSSMQTKNGRNNNAVDSEGTISQMVDQFISVIKKHGEVLQQGNKISFVVKNKKHITTEKMERISYTLRHARRVLERLKKVTGMEFELIDETNGVYQTALKDSAGRYKVLPPINSQGKNPQSPIDQQIPAKRVNFDKEKNEVPLRTYEDYKKLPDPTLRGGLSTGPAISYEQQQIMAAKAQKMREYDEAVRLHNYDKFNSPQMPTVANNQRRSTDLSKSFPGHGAADLSRMQEVELAQFLHQRDTKLRQGHDISTNSSHLRHSFSQPASQSGSKKASNHSNQPITTQSKNTHQSEAFLQLVEREKQRKEHRRKLSCDSNSDSNPQRTPAAFV